MIKSLEERIVNLTKVTTDNVETTVEAELRQLEMKGGVPIQISVVLAYTPPNHWKLAPPPELLAAAEILLFKFKQWTIVLEPNSFKRGI